MEYDYASSVGGIAATETPKSPYREATQRLNEQFDRLEKAVDSLFSRIEGALAPSEPMPDDSINLARAELSPSDVTGAVRYNTSRVGDLAERIENVTRRVDL